jgi:hypothetical protein
VLVLALRFAAHAGLSPAFVLLPGAQLRADLWALASRRQRRAP